MGKQPYSYNRDLETRYTFISSGKKDIAKAVEIVETHIRGLYNLGFGDLLPDGSIDDKVVSDNGDISKVFTTVIGIVNDFTFGKPYIKIMFFGSTDERTKLYYWILKKHYNNFSKKFVISALIEENGISKEVPLVPSDNLEYLAFFIQRIS